MKRKILLSALTVVSAIGLISWGVTGHRTIGRIAEDHLSPQAKAAVRDLLGGESLADASTWADEVRSQPAYRHTAPWHFLNLPLGLNYEQFKTQVEGLTQENVYSALLQQEKILTSVASTREDKAEALKFIVHFVGDLHQPMHISRAEDKGGNTIQLNFDGRGTNLHAIWDSKLLDHLGLNDEQLAAKLTEVQQDSIRLWQSQPLLRWIWESYEISGRLYAEVDQMSNHTVPDDYYARHIPIVEHRLQQAGIRLAGLLNHLFAGGVAGWVAAAGSPGEGVNPPQAPTVVQSPASTPGDTTVCDVVSGGRYFEASGLTLINVGGAYPNQKITILIRGENRSRFPASPESYYNGKQVCVTGHVEMFRGRPEIVVTDPSQIKMP